MRIDEALSQISVIHEQVLRSETFRGYRAVTVAATALLALLAAMLQHFVLPAESVTGFTFYWVLVAGVASAGIAIDLMWQLRGAADRTRTWLALRQLLPAIAIGAVLTWLLLGSEVEVHVPAVWSLCFGLGVVASLPYLPRGLGIVALFYICAGCLLLMPSFTRAVPSSLAMGLVFTCGQGMAAFLLHRAEARLRAPRGDRFGGLSS